LHDERRPKTPQNVFFLDGKGRAAGLVMVRNVHGTVVIVREDLLVISQRSEASLLVKVLTNSPYSVAFARYC
jgi:hypothetical protein